jgi:hypothetical protein
MNTDNWNVKLSQKQSPGFCLTYDYQVFGWNVVVLRVFTAVLYYKMFEYGVTAT